LSGLETTESSGLESRRDGSLGMSGLDPSNFGIGAYSNVRIGAKNFFFDWSLEISELEPRVLKCRARSLEICRDSGAR
jgi:hypothetical protein